MTYKQEQARDRAERVLRHYFATVFRAAGLRWEYDNIAEISDLVEDLITAARQDT